MFDFTYTAVSKSGKKETGHIQAATAAAAGHLLKEQGLLPVAISQRQKTDLLNLLRMVSTVSLSEKISFVENLSIMLKAGISVSRALQIQVKQTKNIKFKAV